MKLRCFLCAIFLGGCLFSVRSQDDSGNVRLLEATVDLDTSRIQGSFINYNKEPEFKRQTVMLQMVVDGAVDLLYYQDDHGRQHFFVREGSGDIGELIYTRYLDETVSPVTIKTNNRFKVQLSSLFPDCGATFAQIRDAEYDWKDLASIIAIGNKDCLGVPEAEMYVAEIPSGHVHLEFSAGVGGNYLHYWGSSFAYDIEEMTIGLRPGYKATLGLIYRPPGIRNGLSFITQIGIFSLAQNGTNSIVVNEEQYTTNTLMVRFLYFNGDLLIRGDLKGKYSPFWQAGYSYGYLIKPEASVQRESWFYTSYNESTDEEPYDIRRNEAALICGLGIRPGRFTLGAHFRIGNGSTRAVGEASFHVLGHLMAGVRF